MNNIKQKFKQKKVKNYVIFTILKYLKYDPKLSRYLGILLEFRI